MSSATNPQSPPRGLLNLDHIAHFVPDREACRLALLQLGFSPAPFSLQYNRRGSGEPLTPVGTGNHCVMFQEGYLEFLVPLGETDVAAQLRSAIARHVGVHSIVLGTADATQDYVRLLGSNFAPLPPIELQRPIDTAGAAATARFTVVRVPPGVMPEGRIQFCRHLTEQLVWQERWLSHPNAAIGISAALVCVNDLDAATERYARFTGLPSHGGQGMRVFRLNRGRIELYTASTFSARFEVDVPVLPWIAGCELRSRDLGVTCATLAQNSVPVHDIADGRVLVKGPAAVGGIFVFTHA